MPIQLSLFPLRGFALQVFHELLTGPDGLPTVKHTRRSAHAVAKRSAVGESAWWADLVRIVPVEVHDADSERPTYTVTS